MTKPLFPLRSKSGFTLVEIMYAGTICVLVIGLALSTFISGLRMMYKDSQRNATNGSLNYFLKHITAKSLDATEFYLFPNYASLDGDVDLSTSWPNSSISPLVTDAFGFQRAEGDCLVLISRMTNSTTANIRTVRICYRVTNDPNTQAPMRIYERQYDQITGTSSSPTTVLNSIDLSSLTTSSPGVTQLVDFAIGRKKPNTTDRYCIFSAEVPFPDPSQANVSINMEVINGKTTGSILSSSCSNYVIAPRK